jgi:hypothetical protein
MGPLRLVKVLKWMSEQLRERIVIPQPGDYKRHGEFRDQAGVDRTRTIWLITDRPLVESTGVSGPERYFLCYDQLYSNENPFHVFDENKPAWKAHTTIPHTLAGAMINVSRPWWPEGATVKIADPFVGTGTTCLECLKFTETVTEGSDLDSSAALLMNDNLAFFETVAPTVLLPSPFRAFRRAFVASSGALVRLLREMVTARAHGCRSRHNHCQDSGLPP